MRQVIFDFGTLELFGRSIGLRVYGYGLMLVLGFLTGIALARWRARRAGEDPERVVWLGMLALIGGIAGARGAYVIEQAATGNWSRFVGSQGAILAVLDVSSGGLIYYGGVILATVLVLAYLKLARLPVRRYLDIVAPSLMIGLAFGRAGCLLNGCCYGSQAPHGSPLAMTFPMYSKPLKPLAVFQKDHNPFSRSTESPSPPYADQFAHEQIWPDERLWVRAQSRDSQGRPVGQRYLLPPRSLHGRLQTEQLSTMRSSPQQALEEFNRLAGIDEQISAGEWQRGLSRQGFLRGSEQWAEAIGFDHDGNGKLSFQEAWDYLQARRLHLEGRFGDDRQAQDEYLRADLFELAAHEHSHPVKPAQALALVNALFLAGLLTVFYRRRRREGQVFALLLVTYPITRFMLEMIRADNEHSLSGLVLTHNQYTSMALLAAGVAMMLWLRRVNPSAGATWAQRKALHAAAEPQGRQRLK